jgi:predicted secreted protein
MANTKFLGTDLMVYVGATPIAHSRSASFKISTALADSTTKDSAGSFTEFLPSIKSWELSTEGLAVWGEMGQWIDAITHGTPLTVSFKPTNQVAGEITLSGTVFLESCEINADNGEVVTYSVSFKGSGMLTSTPKA